MRERNATKQEWGSAISEIRERLAVLLKLAAEGIDEAERQEIQQLQQTIESLLRSNPH
jgi:hypothetical protein